MRSIQPIITPDTMGKIDAAAIGSGINGYGLMLCAGSAISACVLEHYPQAGRATVLCGPGNNGGDGYVAARLLQESGMLVDLYSLVDPDSLKGDAATARRHWDGTVARLDGYTCPADVIVVDALFGAGLARPVDGVAARTIEAVRASGAPVVAADLPSGISGRTGQIEGTAIRAAHSVTFAAFKPGHFLYPGAEYCGELHLVDIGIPQRVVEAHAESLWINTPGLWSHALPNRAPSAHKYTRGHLGVFSGSFAATGAARLAAQSALRSGAGLVTVLSPSSAVAANAAHLTATMLRSVDDVDALDDLLSDRRYTGFVLGPGFGVGERARQFVSRIASAGRRLVLDADGISASADHSTALFEAYSKGEIRLVLTPHEGEFERLFPDLQGDASLSKVDRARQAATRTNAVVIYKGADTVVAAPNGRAVINANAPPWLATAGSGDCLAGMVGALLVQDVAPFEAACAAVYLHGAAGQRAGQGLTAEDLADHIPAFSDLATAP